MKEGVGEESRWREREEGGKGEVDHGGEMVEKEGILR